MDTSLQRFLDAQQDTFDRACTELAVHKKTSHWMWFIFPQLRALGKSDTARYYGISDLTEAESYLENNVLRERLIRVSSLLLTIKDKTAHAILGSPDDKKLQSCMTLFSAAAGADPVFRKVLDQYYGGEEDALTVNLLKNQGNLPTT